MVNFNKKTTAGVIASNIDVSVTAGRDSGKDARRFLRFSFSERVCMMIFGSNPYGVAGQDPENPNRIYFQAEDSIDGYKISNIKEAKRKYCTFGRCFVEDDYASFIGFYNIKYDKVNGAFYIDRAEKKTN